MPETTDNLNNPTPGGGEPNVPSSTEPPVDFFDSFMAGEDSPTVSPPKTPTTESTTGEEGNVPAGEESPGVDAETTLREQVSHMAAIMAEHGITFLGTTPEREQETQTPNPGTQVPTPAPVVTAPAPTWGPTVEVSDEDFQASLENKGVFEKLLTTVRDQAVERTVQSIPQLVSNMIKQQLYLNELSREFYQANEDLAGIRPFVGVVANEIASKNPGLKPEEVLAQTAVAVRQKMALKTNTLATSAAPGPGLPNPGNRGKVVQTNLTGLEADLAQLMTVN